MGLGWGLSSQSIAMPYIRSHSTFFCCENEAVELNLTSNSHVSKFEHKYYGNPNHMSCLLSESTVTMA